LQCRIKNVTENIEVMNTRTALDTVFFEIWNDFRWYLRRNGRGDAKALIEALDIWLRLLAPFAPHICEEAWNRMGKESFISLASWPQYNKTKVNIKTEEVESLVQNMLEDTQNIIRATKIVPKKICYYVATSWKWKAYLTALEKSVSAKVVQSELMRELMQDNDMKKIAKLLVKFISQIVDEVNRMSAEKKQRQLQVGTIDENQSLKEAEAFFKREFNADVYIYREEDPRRCDPKNRAQMAKPYRPAIYIE